MTDPAPIRLDLALVARGLTSSRARAQALIAAGDVTVAGIPADKPSQKVTAATPLHVTARDTHWVGRGARKLLAALDHFNLDPTGTTAVDIGASTGGFTQVLLSRGARRVYAVDVGHGQLHPDLAADPRVVNLEKCNARTITREILPEPPDWLVIDVSFISLTKALPAALDLCAPGATLVALVKPQFEVGRRHLGKGGIVREPALAEAARDRLEQWIAARPGWRSLGTLDSPLLGSDGNREFLLGARYDA